MKGYNMADLANTDFEALLAQYDYKFKKGDIVKGTVFGYDSNSVIVDIGAKNTAYVPSYEVSPQRGTNPEEILQKGVEYEFLRPVRQFLVLYRIFFVKYEPVLVD